MNNEKTIWKICGYMLRVRLTSKRVWLGYLLGIVLVMQQAFGYLAYAADTGKSVNVLEAFIVAGNNYNMTMFLVLGWLLAVSDAPFVDANTRYMLYRSGRKNWNRAMYRCLFLQALFYYAAMAGSTVAFSTGNGYFANIWSGLLIDLTEHMELAADYNVMFAYPALIRTMSAVEAFFFHMAFKFPVWLFAESAFVCV